MINDQLKQQVMEDIVLLWLIGIRVVLVHGGGPEINELMNRLGKKPVFVDGLRVTDKETVDIVQMVLAGKVNKTLVGLLETKGGSRGKNHYLHRYFQRWHLVRGKCRSHS